MIGDKHIIKTKNQKKNKERGGKHESDPKKRGDLWEYPSACRIISAISAGYNTRKLLINEAYIPQPTVNVWLKKLLDLKSAFIFLSNSDVNLNKRKGESFLYDVNYSKLINKLSSEIGEDIKEQKEIIHNAIQRIEERETLIGKRLGNRKAELIRLDNILKKEKDDNLIEEQAIINKKINSMESSLSSYKIIKANLSNFLSLSENLLLNLKERIDLCRTDIEEGLYSCFYFNTLTNNKKRTLKEIFNIFLENIKLKKLLWYMHHPFDKINENLTASKITVNIDKNINKESYFLYELSEYLQRKNSLEVLF